MKAGYTDLRLSHEGRNPGRRCDAWPRSRSVESLVEQFAHRVIAHVNLDREWKGRIIQVIRWERGSDVDHRQVERLERFLRNLRKQHLWGDLTDSEYLSERQTIERQLNLTRRPIQGPQLLNLEHAAQATQPFVRPLSFCYDPFMFGKAGYFSQDTVPPLGSTLATLPTHEIYWLPAAAPSQRSVRPV